MYQLLWTIVALPLAGFVMLALFGASMSKMRVALIGAGSVGVSALVTLALVLCYLIAPPTSGFVSQHLWTWIAAGPLHVALTLRLDALSLTMITVVTVVATLILMYSCAYMCDEEGYSRFFAYMNLFVAAMLVLVLADDLLFLLLGWEGVGLCSYLLIGFWYKEEANVVAARKAFTVTRIGDAALLIGLFLLFDKLGTLNIQEIAASAGRSWPAGGGLPTAAAALLLAGAVGKSAQIPLQTWLPSAMAGPTPVSALIHAATMVTAGMYLIARMHGLFELAPVILGIVAIIGAATLVYGGLAALAQRDIKRVLAYSTISQIGYLFLALGVGAWTAALFHFAVHALFKSLLFLCAGVVIAFLGHEQDLFRMGGLRTKLPWTFAFFLAGAASLSAVPVVTAGFYSKEAILWGSWASPTGGPYFWLCGCAGAFLTSLYSFRMVFLVFAGTARHEGSQRGRESGALIMIPLCLLAIGSLIAGLLQLHPVGGGDVFSCFLGTALPATKLMPAAQATHLVLTIIAGTASLCGIAFAWLLFGRRMSKTTRLETSPVAAIAGRFLLSGLGFDRVYDLLIVRPFSAFTRWNAADFSLAYVAAIARVCSAACRGLSAAHNGKVRWYAAGIALGAIVAVAIGVIL